MRSQFPSQVNIANPSTGCQKLIEVEDERKLYVRPLRMPVLCPSRRRSLT